MTLAKTSILNGIAVVIRLISALLVNKILAIYVGPGGYALIGQFQNTIAILMSVAGGVYSQGLTKYTAQYHDSVEQQHRIWKTAVRASLLVSIIISLSLFLFQSQLSNAILKTGEYGLVFIWLAATLPAIAINNLLLAIVNGKKQVVLYVVVNIFGSIVALSVTGILTVLWGLKGALIAFAVNPAITLVVCYLFVSRQDWFNFKYIWGAIDKESFKGLNAFGIMTLTSAIATPLTFIAIREHLGDEIGLEAAGYWQAIWKISEMYLMVITSTLSIYYLPRLAEIKTAGELKYEIHKVYRFAIPMAIIGATLIYVSRDLVVSVLFSKEFSPMRDLFMWQLVGDVIKIASWVLGYVMLGRAMIKHFISTEIVFSLLFVVLTIVMVNQYGLVGVSMAYAINVSIYLICMMVIVKKELTRMAI
ncbi:MAG: O-antigen translocase [Gammaproteobacteria bacterium]|nr:O-antigen translocase [Gammaproteobacteria bacterium]